MLKSNLENEELGEFVKFGQTGIITPDSLYAMGRLMDSLRERICKIADHRQKGKQYYSEYEADEESVTITEGGFEVRMEHYDRCDGTSYSDAYVSFDEALDPDIMTKIDAENEKARKKREDEDKARQAAALKKNLEAAAERAAFDRFKQWEKDNA